MKALRLASDGMLLLAIVLLVVAVVGPSWAYGAAGCSLLASVVLTVVRRRVRRGRAVQT